MIKDWNRSQVLGGMVFHFKNSLRPFISVSTANDEIFVDLNEMVGYTYEALEYEGLEFYTKEDDEYFKGVKVDGKIEWTY